MPFDHELLKDPVIHIARVTASETWQHTGRYRWARLRSDPTSLRLQQCWQNMTRGGQRWEDVPTFEVESFDDRT